jgi:hypothetical protein
MLSLSRQVEELMMIRCSLLSGEHLTFLDSHLTWNPVWDNDSRTYVKETQTESTETEASKWERLIATHSIADDSTVSEHMDISPARFRVAVDGAKVSFEVNCQRYDGECKTVNECMSIKGDNLSRAMQELWRERIKEGLNRVEHEATGE